MKYIIKDWAGNDLTYHHGYFDSFDDAEHALSIFLGDDYDTDRQEYYIEEEEQNASFDDDRIYND